MRYSTRTSLMLLAALVLLPATASAQTRMVLTFYYPWYGTPDGASGTGKFFHWGQVDAPKKDIAASTNYPQLGAYDSHDPKVMEQHCKWAKEAGIDGLIVSWWGHGSFCDRAMGKVLDGCAKNGLSACIYYEKVPPPGTAKAAAADITRVLAKYGSHPAHLKVDGKPVVFVYSRAIDQLGTGGWLEAIELVREGCKGGVVLIGEPPSRATAWIFDGLHAYNPAGHLRGKSLEQAAAWAETAFAQRVANAEAKGRIPCLTVIPGYDDTKIRTPGLKVDRQTGKLYAALWERAIAANPRWVLITSFNEWHEGSEIEPSIEHGEKYLEATRRFTARFKARPYAASTSPARRADPAFLATLRAKYKGVTIAALPGAASTAYLWLRKELALPIRQLSWQQIAAGRLTPDRYAILLHAGGEKYRRTANTTGDVDAAIRKYLDRGGCLVAAPWRPWPFFYDENEKVVQTSAKFGLTIRQGWEHPPAGANPVFVKAGRGLPHTPDRIAFPTAGDLRWREFSRGKQKRYEPLIQLRDGERILGDAVVYAEPATGGRVLWISALLGELPETERLLADCFDLLSARLPRR